MNTVNDRRQITLRSRICSNIKLNKNASFSSNNLVLNPFSKAKDNLLSRESLFHYETR